jgi:uncharacterized protein YggE
MKKTLTTLALALTISLTNTQLLKAEDNIFQSRHTVHVTGEAKMKVSPDIAYINYTIQTDGKTAESARRINASDSRNITVALKKLGLADKDLQLKNFRINEKREYDKKNKKYVKVGYTATRTFEASVRQLDKVPDFTANIVANGSNRLNNVSYQLENKEAVKLKLISKASRDAKLKAETIVDSFDEVVLGKVLYVSENSTFSYPSNRSKAYARTSMMLESAPSTPGTPEAYAKGEIEVKTTLDCVFAMQ